MEQGKTHAVSKIAEEQKVTDAVKGFLNWYKQFYSTLNSIKLVKYGDMNKPTIYQLNIDNLDRYIQVLVSSGYLSSEYLDELEAYIHDCGRKMEANKQSDGPPEGLEADLILLTHEMDETLTRIDFAVFSDYSMSDSKAEVSVQLAYDLRFGLIRSNGKWLINSIGLPKSGTSNK